MSKKKLKTKKVVENKIPKLSASKRLDLLDQNMVMIHQTVYLLNEKISQLEAQNIAFAKRLAAVVSAASLTEEEVTSGVVAINIKELEEVVEILKKNGNIVEAEEVCEKTFLVVRELDVDGTEVNPRRQFMTNNENISDEIKNQLLGKKVGEIVVPDNNKLKIEILEIYDVVEQPTENIEEVEADAEKE